MALISVPDDACASLAHDMASVADDKTKSRRDLSLSINTFNNHALISALLLLSGRESKSDLQQTARAPFGFPSIASFSLSSPVALPVAAPAAAVDDANAADASSVPPSVLLLLLVEIRD